MKKLMITGLSLAGLSLAAMYPALAGAQTGQTQASNDTGIYLGGNYGGFKSRGGDFDDDRDLVEAVAGWQITRYLAVEGNYIDFGKYGNRTASAEVDGYGAAVVGSLPISNSFSIYAKGGHFWWDGSVEVLNVEHSQDDESWFYGVGALFSINDAIGVTAEYKRYDIEYDSSKYPVPPNSSDTDIDSVTVGVRVSF